MKIKTNRLLLTLTLAAVAAVWAAAAPRKATIAVADKSETLCSQALDYIYGQNGRPVDMEKAWELFNQAREDGSAEAVYYIAEMYNYGLYVSQDMTKYIINLHQAANMGSVDAIADLGALTLYGSRRAIVKKDERAGVEMLTKAAGQNHPRALIYLGHCYRDGLGGIVRDESRAYSYYNKAAEAGNAQGYVEMAQCHIAGLGAEENFDKAHALLVKAENQGSSDASRVLGNMYFHGDGLEPNDSIAHNYYKRAVAAGNTQAMSDLAWMYVKGGGGVGFYSHAFDLFGIAASDDVPAAVRGLGHCYENGYGTVLDVPMAVSCYKRAAAAGDGGALYNLYKLYRNGGENFAADPDKARDYLDEGVRRGDNNAMYALGHEYITGGLIKVDAEKGLEYITNAAKRGNSQAQAELGNMYYAGDNVVKRDYDKAFGYLQQAIRHPEDIDDDILAKVYRNLAACYRFGRGTDANIDMANVYTSMSHRLGDREMGDVMRFYNNSSSY